MRGHPLRILGLRNFTTNESSIKEKNKNRKHTKSDQIRIGEKKTKQNRYFLTRI